MLEMMIIIEILIITVALSTDSFMSGLAYGSSKIKLPFLSILVISSICSMVLGLSMLFGTWISRLIPVNITKIISVVILIIIGFIKIIDGFIKKMINRQQGINKYLEFSLFNIKLTLTLYAKPEEADFDHSKVLSIYESTALALALSLDSLTLGFGTGLVFSHLEIIVLFVFSLIMGIVALLLGSKLGQKIGNKKNLQFSWLGGLILIIMAIIKFLFY